MDFTERSTRVYKTKQLYSKEELAAREALCVHEQPAFCTAACPLRIDARELTRLCADGDFTAARAMLERATPFAQILAAGCEAPCAGACRLAECGAESVNIPALERAAMRCGQPRTGRGLLKFRKKKTAAVFGSELFSLIVAAELAVKSYPTVFYVSAPGAEELISGCAPFLCPEDAAAQAGALEKLDLKIVYGCKLSAEFIASERAEYDLVCVSQAAYALLGGSGPDPVTLYDGALGVLARPGADASVIGAFYDARRAGVSADRLAQGMSPASSRGEEGPVTSTLYTDLSAVAPSRRVAENGVYSPGEAQSEAARCIQCECTECIKGCVWLQHYGKFPRIMTREIYNNVGIIMGDHMMNGAINSCALCSQCTVTCPNGYDMAEICLSARRNMVDTGKMSLAVHEFALLDQLFSNGEAFLCRAEPGFEKCEYVFFPGCQAGAVAPEAVWRTYADLRARLGGGVGILLGCCGIISRWAGREELFNETCAQLQDALATLGNPKIITTCPTCAKTLAPLGECIGIWDVLLEIGLPADAPHAVGEVTLHDACGARGDAHTRSAVRELASRLGCTVTEPEYSGERAPCCGYGGLAGYAKPEVAEEMTAFALDGTDGLQLTYCMGCRDRYARAGAESAHMLELVYGAAAGAAPGISEKRRNRLELKRRMLREIWMEDDAMEALGFKLEFTGEARALMEERMVLDTDVAGVMRAYRASGEAVLENDTGLLVTRLRIGNVTFWVKFTEDADGYTVHRVYSHRMTIETR